MNYLKLIPFLLIVLLLLSCGDDFEEITTQVIANDNVDRVKNNGKVLTSEITPLSGGLGSLVDRALPDATIRVFQNSLLLQTVSTDRDGEYDLEFPVNPADEEPIFLEISKDGFAPSIIPIDPISTERSEWYLLENNIIQNEITPGDDEVILSGRIDYNRVYYVRATWEEPMYGSRGRGATGPFQIVVPRNRPVQIEIFNELLCQAEIPVSTFPVVFTEDLDVGDISDIIDFDEIITAPIEIPMSPDCFDQAQLIINGGAVDLDNQSEILACESIMSLEYHLIDYENNANSNTVDLFREDLVFGCSPYNYEFEVSTDFGSFDENTNGVVVNSFYHSRFPLLVGGREFREVFHFDVKLNEEWNSSFIIGLVELPDEITTSSDLYSIILPESTPALLYRTDQEVASLTLESPSGGRDFMIDNGFFEGTLIVTQVLNDVETHNVQIFIKAPILNQ